ncbi:MAG: DUF2752 domain-containing protein [Lachnospiraceae bacterium]|nr:DUF2752 domain-containing protein [Lachnospiraceae bacterium]
MEAVNNTAQRQEWYKKAERLIVAAGLPLCLLLIALYITRGGGGIKCMFHELTGFYCAGCGSTRALNAVFRGDFAKAFSYNCMLFFLGIPCLFVLAHEYIRITFPGIGLRPVRISQRAAGILTAVLIAFWILRNVPALAFLAP